MFDSLKRPAARAALAAGVLARCAFSAAATDPRFTFTRVADTGTPVPGSGSPGTFSGFPEASMVVPAADAGSVVFLGRSDQGRTGIYRWTDGRLAVVVDSTFPTDASGQEQFTGFTRPVVSGPNVAFVGGGNRSGGVYLVRGSEIARIAAVGTPAPDGLGTLTDIGLPTLWNDEVSFRGVYSALPGSQAIFRYRNGTLQTVARTGSLIPGGTGTFISLSDVNGSGGELAFRGSGIDRAGVFRTSGNSLVRVAEVFMKVPDNERDYFGNVGPWVNADGGQAAFLALEGNADRYSIWTESGGQFVRRATSTDRDATGPDQFRPSDTEAMISLDDDHVALQARTVDGGAWSLFTDLGGRFTRVIGPGDTLFGKTLSSIQAGPNSLSGGDIAFAAFFRDGSSGIYLATVPEPGAWALAAAAGSLALLSRRRSRAAT